MKKHILVVDDEQSMRELCKDFLEEEGYKVSIAVDGQDALEKMNYDDFDLYIVDINMPRIGGFELMKQIKHKQPLAVIIILTGYSSIEGAVKAVHAGAFEYISKPINAEELSDVVKCGLQYSDDLYGPLQKAFESADDKVSKSEPNFLHGFSPEDKVDFMSLGRLKKYDVGETIPLSDEGLGSIVVLESGEVSVWMSNTTIDCIQKWDTWGEENFILAGSITNSLRAETAVKVRHFTRKKLLDFFTYKGEKLFQRFTLNLVNCIFLKWRKAIQRIVMLKLITGDN